MLDEGFKKTFCCCNVIINESFIKSIILYCGKDGTVNLLLAVGLVDMGRVSCQCIVLFIPTWLARSLVLLP